jgi:hypothetical protein
MSEFKTPSMKNIIITLIILTLIPVAVRSQFEKNDAVYESLIREYTLNQDGSVDYRFIKRQKLLTYRAFHNLYGETFIVYDTTCQKLKINDVNTVMADGKKIPAPANAFNPALPGVAANAPAYNSLREMVITHTGLERGSTVNLDYQVHTTSGILPCMSGLEVLAENEPVQEFELRIRVPEKTELFYKLVNSEEKPVRMKEGSYEVYSWTFRNVAALLNEEWQPALPDGVPALFFSTAKDQDKIFSWFSGRSAFSFEISPEMREAVAGVMEEKKDRETVVLRLQEMVTEEMRLYPVPASMALYRTRNASETWKSNGGTVVEKAVLLTALLRQAGVGAQVAAISRLSLIDPVIAGLFPLEDFCVMVDMKDKGTWYLSVTQLNQAGLNFTGTDRTFIHFEKGGKVSREDAEPARSMVKVNGTFLISSDPQLTGEVNIYLEGQAYPRIGLFRDKNKIRNSLTGQLIRDDSASLKKSALNNGNGYQVYTVKNEKPFRKDTNLYVFRLPQIGSGIDSWGLKTLSEKRESAFEIPAKADEGYQFSLALPSDMKLITPEQRQNISNGAGVFQFEVKTEKGKVVVNRSLKFSKSRFSKEEYPALKALLDGWNSAWNRVLILGK